MFINGERVVRVVNAAAIAPYYQTASGWHVRDLGGRWVRVPESGRALRAALEDAGESHDVWACGCDECRDLRAKSPI